MKKCFLYTNDGFYAGESVAYGRLPGNATFEAPPARPWTGKWPRFAGGRWVFEEDHRERSPQLFGGDAQEGTDYWLAEDNWESQGRKMTRPGPLPEGALLARPEKPDPTEAEQAEAQGHAILDKLTEFDAKAARPMRAMLAGAGTDEDKAQLADIERQAQALREELAALGIDVASL